MFQRMLGKKSIYKQIITGAGNSNQNVVEHNRRVKSYKKVYENCFFFFAQKKFAIRENFEDVVDISLT